MSEQTFNNIGVIILAAGKGKRMQSNQLKVMHLLNGRPLIDHVISAVESLNFNIKPTVVVCAEDPAVQNFLGSRANYVIQTERLGTGHAVAQAESVLFGKVNQVVVLYGDMPFITSESIKNLINTQLERNNTITLATVTAVDFNDWRASLNDYGRIVRGGQENHIIKIVEKKDCSPEELEIKEFNTGFYCFNSEWLWSNLKNLKNNNVQGEYYLTDLVGLAVAKGNKISSVSIEPKEAVGINTKENLEVAHTI
ncbi:MAG: Bifunctional protein GlmU [Candidatus Magasanikbacteria bacterium GW2011_GWC2_34_16]|uniref:Bifunctional protein GlmU n=2 Tax=Candidatus Magasanikiibacteriota TaxID=1752731 RepID=A0A0G0HPG6_9BACT|nr:MAG: Bifunctional protein GlmU [Candidatus Magasanikbacteria bacterium GW2011_GWC2_34_16]KKQ40500.1 MAG: Bifunctional protein GlmU [Candidatus Magasanikbacteria bacterium GW2011_GWA2_37_8]